MTAPTTLLQDLQTVLKSLAAGGAWYQVNEAQPPVYPYITYARVVSATNNVLSAPTDLQNTRVQIDVYARSIAQAEAIADSVGPAMRAGPWKSAVQLSVDDLYEDEIRAYRLVLDFSIWATN